MMVFSSPSKVGTKKSARLSRRFCVCLLLVALVLSQSACGFKLRIPFFGKDVDPEALPQTIRVGLATDAPPLSWEANGASHGLDSQLAANLANFTGRETQTVRLPRKELVAALESGQVDVVMAGLTATETKELHFAATRGYLPTGLAALTRLGQEKKLGSKSGLKAEAVRIGTVLGSSGPAYVKSIRAKGTHLVFATPQAAVDALLRKRIDVALLEMPACFHYAARHIEDGLMPGTKPLTRDEIVWATRKDDKDLLRMLNRYLEEKSERGDLDSLVRKSLPFYSAKELFRE